MFRVVLCVIVGLSSITVASGMEMTFVVLRDGKPVPDAVVNYRLDEKPVPVLPKAVDATGKVTLDLDLNQHMTIYATAPGWIGLQRNVPFWGDGVVTPAQPIHMVKATQHKGRFVDSEGKPLSGVEVKCAYAHLHDPSRSAWYDGSNYTLPDTLGWKATTDADGRFTFSNIPEGYALGIVFECAMHGHGTISRLASNHADVVLKEAGKIHFTYDPPESEPKSQSRSTYPRISAEHDPLYKIDGLATSYLNETRTNPRTYSHIVPGKYRCSANTTSKEPWCYDSEWLNFDVLPGKTTEVTIKATPAVLLTGRVVDKATGAGLDGITLDVEALSNDERQSTRTDKDGHYRFSVLGGKTYALRYSNALKSGDRYFAQPPREGQTRSIAPVLKVDGQGPHTFKTLELSETRTVRGVIVDAEGKPWHGPLELLCPTDATSLDQGYHRHITVEGNKFTIRGVPTDNDMKFWARGGNAVNLPERIPEEKLDEIITLRLSDKNSARAVGKITDTDGGGIAGVKVNLQWHYNIAGSGGSSTTKIMSTTISNEKGEFSFDSCWPNERYSVRAVDERFGYVMQDHNATKTAPPGGTITLETLTVKPRVQTVSGTVVHLDGSPVVGVKVFSNGELPAGVSTVSDASGKFTLKGLPKGQLFLLAAHDGYRPTYLAWNTNDDKPAKLTLRKVTDPAAPSPAATPEFLAARKKALGDAIEMCWAKRDELGGYEWSMYINLCQIDRDRAKQMLTNANADEARRMKKYLHGSMSDAEFAKLALEDPEEVFDRTNLSEKFNFYRIVAVGELLLTQDKAKALLFAEEAANQARSLVYHSPFWKTTGLAYAASLAHRAGNKDGGNKLMAEVFELLAKFDKVGSVQQALSEIIPQIAKYDLPAAFAKLPLFTDHYYHNFTLAKLLCELAKTDPKAALGKLSQMKSSEQRSSTAHHAVVFAATIEREPELTLATLAKIDKFDVRIHAYLEMAVAIAPKDPAQAHSFIDLAMKQVEEGGTSSVSLGDSIHAGLAAQVATFAHRVNYSDVHALIARTLMLRSQMPPSAVYPSGAIHLAMALSEVDPASAKWLLTTVRSDAELESGIGDEFRTELFTTAMVHPEMFLKTIRKTLVPILNEAKFSETRIVETFSQLANPGRELDAAADRWLHFAPLKIYTFR